MITRYHRHKGKVSHAFGIFSSLPLNAYYPCQNARCWLFRLVVTKGVCLSRSGVQRCETQCCTSRNGKRVLPVPRVECHLRMQFVSSSRHLFWNIRIKVTLAGSKTMHNEWHCINLSSRLCNRDHPTEFFRLDT
jgi:hypothetical protein